MVGNLKIRLGVSAVPAEGNESFNSSIGRDGMR
jgi:hypothetical protein